MKSSYANLNALWAARLVETLVAGGVKRVVVSPGSRSTPLAIACHAHPALRCHVLIDERSAAFFALGLARGEGAPVALVCTSGTAAANYHPAVIEASLAGVPLVVLTADRPMRLRQLGAPQTIDQTRLYGSAVRHFVELATPEPTAGALSAMQAQVAFATAAALGAPRGPVHLNVPFDDPLAPVAHDTERVARLAAEACAQGPGRSVRHGRRLADEGALAELAARVAAAERPLLLAGPTVERGHADALLAWAAAAGVPVVADIGAGLRRGASDACVAAHADLFLRSAPFQAEGPDLLIHVGGAPVAKGIQLYMQRHRPPTIALQPDALGRDPDALATLVITGDWREAFGRLRVSADPALAPARSAWLGRWRQAEGLVREGLATGRFAMPAEAALLLAAARELGPEGRLCLSNSLPIRHADSYWPGGVDGPDVAVFRGANGIDGVTSMSLGLAVASGQPTLLATGDLAFLHDLGGLFAARGLETPFVILVSNNDGGGIFSYLPVAEATSAFEPLFGTPHGLDFAPAGALFGLRHVAAEGPEAVAEAVRAGLARPGVTIVEAPSDRAATAQAHRALVASVAAAFEAVTA